MIGITICNLGTVIKVVGFDFILYRLNNQMKWHELNSFQKKILGLDEIEIRDFEPLQF